jgi:hypothetical protein
MNSMPMFKMRFFAVLLTTLAGHSAFAGTETTATARQWQAACTSGKSSCTVVSQDATSSTYKACAAGKCFDVVCSTGAPDSACSKTEIIGIRPQPKRLQAGIFGLL